jgi:hypothetical protein
MARQMKKRSKIIRLFSALGIAAWGGVLLAPVAAEAAGRRVAIIEEGAIASAKLQEFDLLDEGQELVLGPNEVVVIGYMSSCRRETITGGTVIIGAKESNVAGGKLAWEDVTCTEPQLSLTANESQQSGTLAFRPADSIKRIYTQTPMLQGLEPGPLSVEIISVADKKSLGKFKSDTGRIDLADEKILLKPGKAYEVRLAESTVTLEVDVGAKAGGSTLERVVPLKQ